MKIKKTVLMDKLTGDLALSWVEGGVCGPLKLSRTLLEKRFTKGWTITTPVKSLKGYRVLGSYTELVDGDNDPLDRLFQKKFRSPPKR